MNLESIINIINKAIGAYYGVVIAFGCIIMLYGLMLLIFNRRVIKALYFIGGFTFFGLLSAAIGLAIVVSKAGKLDDSDKAAKAFGKDIIIAFGCSAGVGLIFGILAACFGKFGIVLVGMSAGFGIGAAIGLATGNSIALLVLALLFTIIGGTLCGVFKRPAEVVASAVMGGIYFGTGYRSLFTGVLDLQSYNYLKKFGENLTEAQQAKAMEKSASFFANQERLAKAANISSIVLLVVTIIGFGAYHIFTYRKNHSKQSEKDILLQKSPAYNPV